MQDTVQTVLLDLFGRDELLGDHDAVLCRYLAKNGPNGKVNGNWKDWEMKIFCEHVAEIHRPQHVFICTEVGYQAGQHLLVDTSPGTLLNYSEPVSTNFPPRLLNSTTIMASRYLHM